LFAGDGVWLKDRSVGWFEHSIMVSLRLRLDIRPVRSMVRTLDDGLNARLWFPYVVVWIEDESVEWFEL
jgi:hypothetical protein